MNIQIISIDEKPYKAIPITNNELQQAEFVAIFQGRKKDADEIHKIRTMFFAENEVKK